MSLTLVPEPERLRRLAMQENTFRQFLIFGIVGAIGFVVDGGLMLALHHLAGFHPVSARPFSFAVAVSVTWLLNRRLTFAERASPERIKELSRYTLVNGMGAALNLVVFYWLLLAFDYMSERPLLALAIAAAVALLFNFSASKLYAFRWVGGRACSTSPGEEGEA